MDWRGLSEGRLLAEQMLIAQELHRRAVIARRDELSGLSQAFHCQVGTLKSELGEVLGERAAARRSAEEALAAPVSANSEAIGEHKGDGLFGTLRCAKIQVRLSTAHL
ncbi:MAG: hypothetical protein ACR2PA_01950 [Hyphomicrobiaceae bacterium]